MNTTQDRRSSLRENHAPARSDTQDQPAPLVRRYLDGLQISLYLEGRLPGGKTLEHSFLVRELVEHRGEPALICTCPRGKRRRFLLRYLDTVTETASGTTHYDPEVWFHTLLAQLPAPVRP